MSYFFIEFVNANFREVHTENDVRNNGSGGKVCTAGCKAKNQIVCGKILELLNEDCEYNERCGLRLSMQLKLLLLFFLLTSSVFLTFYSFS